MIPRTYPATLETLRFGALAQELTQHLRELTAACSQTGNKGSLTLTLTLTPGKGGQIEVDDEVKLKPPRREKSSTLMFATAEHHLQRDDPRQMQIEGLRSVDPDTGELRQIAAGA